MNFKVKKAQIAFFIVSNTEFRETTIYLKKSAFCRKFSFNNFTTQSKFLDSQNQFDSR